MDGVHGRHIHLAQRLVEEEHRKEPSPVTILPRGTEDDPVQDHLLKVVPAILIIVQVSFKFAKSEGC